MTHTLFREKKIEVISRRDLLCFFSYEFTSLASVLMWPPFHAISTSITALFNDRDNVLRCFGHDKNREGNENNSQVVDTLHFFRTNSVNSRTADGSHFINSLMVVHILCVFQSEQLSKCFSL